MTSGLTSEQQEAEFHCGNLQDALLLLLLLWRWFPFYCWRYKPLVSLRKRSHDSCLGAFILPVTSLVCGLDVKSQISPEIRESISCLHALLIL